MADAPPLSALWWLERLEPQLDARRARLESFDAYYEGNHPLPFVTEAHGAKMQNEFRRLLEESRSNFCRLVVDAVEERLQVEGFRLSASQDEVADQGAWDIWQANQMDAEAPTAVLDALVKGYAYLSVWKGAKSGDRPVIAVEDPCETIISYTPGSNYRLRDAAVKIWKDNVSGVLRANVYLRDGIYKFYSPKDEEQQDSVSTAYAAGIATSQPKTRWLAFPRREAFVPNQIGIVPVVSLRNRPRVRVEGESELKDITTTQNQINGFLFLLALAGYFGAHRQRWASGVPLMKDADGNPIDPWDSAVDKLWWSTKSETQFGEFGQTDLAPYISAIEQKVLHIAVTTRTPRHYLIEQGQSPSGDAIRSAESGLVRKSQRKMRPFGEGFEETIRLARLFAGETDAPVDSEIVWADASTPTPAELTDSTIKRYQAGLVTRQQAQADLGYSQTQIQRMAADLTADALLRSITAPPENPAVETPPAGA